MPRKTWVTAAILSVAVVVALGTGVLLGLSLKGGTSTGRVTVTGTSWNETWAPAYSGSPYHFSDIAFHCYASNGSEIDLNGSFDTGGTLSCAFHNTNNTVQGGGSVPTRQIIIISVEVSPPFSVLASNPFSGPTCMNCQIYGVEVGLPSSSGSYFLTGTVLFGWR